MLLVFLPRIQYYRPFLALLLHLMLGIEPKLHLGELCTVDYVYRRGQRTACFLNKL